ncbi:Uncharacterised protein [Mycobacteroides abscessus subsp. massiliense]|nr:Uncharacterised protein [Mycobacteroides abscessus subsp. massiliense]
MYPVLDVAGNRFGDSVVGVSGAHRFEHQALRAGPCVGVQCYGVGTRIEAHHIDTRQRRTGHGAQKGRGRLGGADEGAVAYLPDRRRPGKPGGGGQIHLADARRRKDLPGEAHHHAQRLAGGRHSQRVTQVARTIGLGMVATALCAGQYDGDRHRTCQREPQGGFFQGVRAVCDDDSGRPRGDMPTYRGGDLLPALRCHLSAVDRHQVLDQDIALATCRQQVAARTGMPGDAARAHLGRDRAPGGQENERWRGVIWATSGRHSGDHRRQVAQSAAPRKG